MHIIIQSWLESLAFLVSRNFFEVLKQAFRCWIRTMVLLVTTLRWFFLIDFMLFALVGQKIIEMIHGLFKGELSPHHATAFFYLVASVMWFIVYTAGLLFIRWTDEQNSPMSYLKDCFFRFVQLSFFLGLIAFICIIFLIGFGISLIPSLHWSVAFLIHLLELVTLFYWLDSTFSFKELLNSCEKSINFVFYNLPLMLSMLGLLWLSEFFLRVILLGWANASSQDYLMLVGKVDVLVKNQLISVPTFFLFKYLKFMSELFWIGLLFVFYHIKKEITYAESFFDEKPVE